MARARAGRTSALLRVALACGASGGAAAALRHRSSAHGQGAAAADAPAASPAPSSVSPASPAPSSFSPGYKPFPPWYCPGGCLPWAPESSQVPAPAPAPATVPVAAPAPGPTGYSVPPLPMASLAPPQLPVYPDPWSPPPLVPFVPAHNYDAVEFRVTVANAPGEVSSQTVVSHMMEQILRQDKRGPAMRAFLVKYGIDPLAKLPAAISSDVELPLGPLELPATTTPAQLSPGELASLPMRPAPLAYSARGHSEERQALRGHEECAGDLCVHVAGKFGIPGAPP